MADFFQPQQQQDPDAIRKAMLLKMFGAAAGGGQPAGVPPNSMMNPTKPVNMTPTGDADPAQRPLAAKPTAQPLATAAAAANNNGGNMEPGSAPPILPEADWQKQNPGPEHKPYVEPDLKHRLLMGLFGGMQNFGHDPGAGERMLGNYLSNIQQNEEKEKNYPQQAAADAHQRYMTAAQGAEVPLHLKNLQAEIDKRQAEAQAKLHPPEEFSHIAIKDPADPEMAKPALFNKKTGAILDPDTKLAIPGAQLWEKPTRPEKQNDFDQYYGQWMKDTKQPDTAANRLAAHKQWEIKPEQPGANDTRLDRSYQYNNNIIEKQRTPLDQRLERLDRVEQAINQKSAQADALIAPELLSVMVGGMGSGLRMSEAEISRIVGGRSKLEDLKAKLDKWDPRTGGGLSVTDEQRKQMLDLLKAVREKTEAKQRAFDEAQEALIHAGDVGEHRKITADLKKKLSAIDGGAAATGGNQGQPGALPPGWK